MSETEHTPLPWRTWDVFAERGEDEYPEPSKGDLRLVGANKICIGVVFGGMLSIPEADKNAPFIVEAVNGYAASLSREAALREALEASELALTEIKKWVRPSGYAPLRYEDAMRFVSRALDAINLTKSPASEPDTAAMIERVRQL